MCHRSADPEWGEELTGIAPSGRGDDSLVSLADDVATVSPGGSARVARQNGERGAEGVAVSVGGYPALARVGDQRLDRSGTGSSWMGVVFSNRSYPLWVL
jgi:hypothetical protein